jgi:malonate-semialdehyde dehydrogenase (acetylating)/methylmalonate-semialdehyde dehydrogenase
MHHIGHWINGHHTDGESGRSGPVYDPATGEQTGEVALASPAEVDAAVAHAREAAVRWGRTSISRRTAVLFAFRDLLAAATGELAQAIAAEQGKVITDAEGEIARGLENVEFACGVGDLLKGEFSSSASTGVDVHSVREPLGVVVGITPYNFPVMVPLWMCATAIAAGNAFVLKPSEKDPSPSLLLARLWQEAGLPAGVFTVLNGDAGTVEALLDHDDVAAVSFVGSTPVARAMHVRASSNGKRVQALGGAKNHMVVLPDADVDLAADAAVSAAYGAAGQRCMAISVVVAVGDVADALAEAIAVRIPKLQVGAAAEAGSQMGPLISAAHRDAVAAAIGRAETDGADLVVDGRQAQLPASGFFLGPTLIDHVRPGTAAHRDEIFGPVLSMVRTDTYAQALEAVNSSDYGNGAAIFTRDGGAARAFAQDVEAGMVGVNVAIPVPVGYHSFGGWKASLFGDSHMYGPEGLTFYTRAKVVTTRWPDPGASEIDLGFPRTR